MKNIPRPEHPRPDQFRKEWINLNGEWEYEIDNAKIGREKKFFERESLSDGTILVPFCPESDLSGLSHTDFINAIWYRRDLDFPKSWVGKRILLNFGAVDYHAVVYINGKHVGSHKGGYTPFSFDITKYLKDDGKNYVTLAAYDDVRSGEQPAGKQCETLNYHSCMYKRTTGIWQTVWAQAVPQTYIKNVKITPELASSSAVVEVLLDGVWSDKNLEAVATFDGRVVGQCKIDKLYAARTTLTLSLSETHIWEIGAGRLYDLTIKAGDDELYTYFGLRSVSLEGGKFMLNGKSVFGRWILDQGFYPDGIYTAKDDEALKADIIYSQQLGFNGARMHEKIFEPRFLYHADKMGYLVWGEHANWGLDITTAGAVKNFLPEWLESVERDYSHPSLIGWCPFNETWDRGGRPQDNNVLSLVYLATKAADPTRPVIDTSGNFHVITDIYDIHDYEQDATKFSANYGPGGKMPSHFRHRSPEWVKGTPYFVSEYGGIAWNPDKKDGWGYGNSPMSEEEYLKRYEDLTTALLDNPEICAFCYTQLYDVQQELNGLMTYERVFKFPPEIFYKINTKKAAIED